jgi:AGZA family xanthine/uracil permease-like MFS transporter
MRLAEFFKFSSLQTNFKNEILGALSTFSAMVYIIVVHPTLLSQAGLPFGPVMTTTILITALSSLLMGLLGKVPLAIAPAMGVSAYFTFTLVQRNGLPVEEALFTVFCAALALVILNFFQLRRKILNAIPESLLIGITGGIGLFLIAVGFKQIGIVALSDSGLLTLVKPAPIPLFFSAMGLLCIALFDRLRLQASFILTILLIWALAYITGQTSPSAILALPPSIAPILGKLAPPSQIHYAFFKGLLSIFLVTLFDSSAGLMTLKKVLPKPAQNFDMQKALYPDAIGSLLGSYLGTSSLAIHLESMAGIKAGGRSGLTAVIVSCCFILCLFFYPLASSIPLYASAPVVIAIGFMMSKQLVHLKDFSRSQWMVPLLTALIMPMTLSLYQGFRLGFIALGLLSIVCPKIWGRSALIRCLGGVFFIEWLMEYFQCC